MTRPCGHGRVRYSTPAKGTKLRRLILLMLRPQGVTMGEAAAELGVGHLSGQLAILTDFGGWDVRRFPVANPSPTSLRSHVLVSAYRIVGRDRWGGGYRSLLGGLDASSRVR